MFLSRDFSRRDVRSTRLRRQFSVEALEGRQLLATFTVTNVNDSGPGSLRQAILSSNAATGSATNAINFQVGSGGTETISLLSALPGVTHPVVIDGTTQPGTGTAPHIVLDGTNAGANSAGLTLTKSSSTVEGLAIDNFAEYAINVSGSSNVIADNYLGLTPAGALAANTHNAINLTYATGNTITGNVVSGNLGNGIEVYDSSNNLVTGNLVGTNPAGTAALPNQGNAVKIEAGSKGNVIGGTALGASNVLSGNTDCGVMITTSSNRNFVEGNLILGCNASTPPRRRQPLWTASSSRTAPTATSSAEPQPAPRTSSRPTPVSVFTSSTARTAVSSKGTSSAPTSPAWRRWGMRAPE